MNMLLTDKFLLANEKVVHEQAFIRNNLLIKTTPQQKGQNRDKSHVLSFF